MTTVTRRGDAIPKDDRRSEIGPQMDIFCAAWLKCIVEMESIDS